MSFIQTTQIILFLLLISFSQPQARILLNRPVSEPASTLQQTLTYTGVQSQGDETLKTNILLAIRVGSIIVFILVVILYVLRKLVSLLTGRERGSTPPIFHGALVLQQPAAGLFILQQAPLAPPHPPGGRDAVPGLTAPIAHGAFVLQQPSMPIMQEAPLASPHPHGGQRGIFLNLSEQISLDVDDSVGISV